MIYCGIAIAAVAASAAASAAAAAAAAAAVAAPAQDTAGGFSRDPRCSYWRELYLTCEEMQGSRERGASCLGQTQTCACCCPVSDRVG